MKASVPVLTCVILLSACAGWERGVVGMDAERKRKALNSSQEAIGAAPVCCQSPREFSYAKITLPFEGRVTVDRKGPAFSFPKGKSFFKAFELPQSDVPYLLEIESELSRAFFPFFPSINESWFFGPVLLFLDDEHQPVSVVRNFQFIGPGVFRSAHLAVQVLMDEHQKAARYLVVYTDPEYMDQLLPYTSQGGAYGVVAGKSILIVPQVPTKIYIPFNYEGELTIATSKRSEMQPAK